MTTEELLKDRSKWADGFQTRDGRPVRILTAEVNNEKWPVVALVTEPDGTEVSGAWSSTGAQAFFRETRHDLIPRPVKRKGWIAICKMSSSIHIAYASHVYKTESAARAHQRKDILAVIEVEWEEPQ